MKYSFIFLLILFFFACYNEDDITPTEGDEFMFSLPQGNHPHDDQIMEWKDKYGFYTIYKFEEKDVYWNNTNWDEMVEVGIGGSMTIRPADTNYVAPIIQMLKESFIDLYPEDFLKECMPLKVFVCSGLWSGSWKTDYSTNITYRGDSTRMWAHRGYDFIAVNGASLEIDTMKAKMKTGFMQEINKIFMQILVEQEKLVMPEAFGKVSDYTNTSAPWGEVKFERGFLNTQTVKSTFSLEQALSLDFGFYLTMVLSYSVEELEAEPVVLSAYSNALYLDYTGVLNVKRDTKGLVRKKYEIIVDYIENEMGIDISAIRFPSKEN